jgi:tetratricopeptide (TPR) repeat protein
VAEAPDDPKEDLMKSRTLLTLAMVTLVATPALASFGSKPDSPPPSSSSSQGSTEASGQKTPRQEAEGWYNDAYGDVSKAKDLLAQDKPDKKKADKMFKRAIERADEALKLDKNYYEALNLQGFSWRKLGDYPKSLDAYAACLRIEPDYAPAREYYGQALLESGDRDGAAAQLAYLKRLKADDLAKQLEDAIAAAPVKETKAKDASTTGAGSR